LYLEKSRGGGSGRGERVDPLEFGEAAEVAIAGGEESAVFDGNGGQAGICQERSSRASNSDTIANA
jgi:hypothetical protein